MGAARLPGIIPTFREPKCVEEIHTKRCTFYASNFSQIPASDLLFSLVALRLWYRLSESHHEIIAPQWMCPVVHDEIVETVKHNVVYQVILHLA